MRLVTVFESKVNSNSGLRLKKLFAIRRSIGEAVEEILSGHSDELFASYTFVIEELSEEDVAMKLRAYARRFR